MENSCLKEELLQLTWILLERNLSVFHTCVEHSFTGNPISVTRVEVGALGGKLGAGAARLGGPGAWEGRWPAVSPALPCLGCIQALGGAAAGEEPLAAVRERHTAYLQQ